ncbi:MAG TPA: glycosyltransferase 87 family protein, partial [Vicinamibacteria bacterium]|nr:glycosyltransferase 87 family protein [Vicinamibacteria bacterium]
MPALLLLAARELHLHDPLRVLGWRMLHEAIAWPAWLRPLLPTPSGAIDRDPVALALTSLAILIAIAYAAAAPFVRLRSRAALLGLGTLVLVLLPTIGLVTMGFATGRPYGQDGGVVQLPLAMDRLLAGQSPYGADYSDSMLGRQARVSSFWREYGGNPILRHHAYLPGTHALMLPAYVACRALLGAFDTRFVTLAAFVLTAVLAFHFGRGGARGLAAAGIVLVNPLVWWHQVFGANDIMVAGLLLGAALAADRGRRSWAGALLGVACATKQLAWPYAPFLAIHLLGATSFRDLARLETWRSAARPLLAAAAVFLAIVVPVLALDPRAFWGDIVAYNIGLAGGDAYPLGGTPGFGLANLLIYFGAVGSLKDHVSFAPFYLLLIPLGLLMLRRQMRERDAAMPLVLGSVALVASLYFSRVVHPNYLVLAAILLPLGCLARGRDALLAVGPLSLLAVAVEYAQNEVLRTAWEQALARGAAAFLGALSPRAGTHLTPDPLGALVS